MDDNCNRVTFFSIEFKLLKSTAIKLKTKSKLKPEPENTNPSNNSSTFLIHTNRTLN